MTRASTPGARSSTSPSTAVPGLPSLEQRLLQPFSAALVASAAWGQRGTSGVGGEAQGGAAANFPSHPAWEQVPILPPPSLAPAKIVRNRAGKKAPREQEVGPLNQQKNIKISTV